LLRPLSISMSDMIKMKLSLWPFCIGGFPDEVTCGWSASKNSSKETRTDQIDKIYPFAKKERMVFWIWSHKKTFLWSSSWCQRTMTQIFCSGMDAVLESLWTSLKIQNLDSNSTHFSDFVTEDQKKPYSHWGDWQSLKIKNIGFWGWLFQSVAGCLVSRYGCPQ